MLRGSRPTPRRQRRLECPQSRASAESPFGRFGGLPSRGPLEARGAAPRPDDAARVRRLDHLAAAASLGGGSKALARASALQLSSGSTCRWAACSTPRHSAVADSVAAEAHTAARSLRQGRGLPPRRIQGRGKGASEGCVTDQARPCVRVNQTEAA